MADLTLHSNTESFIGDIKRLVEQGRNAAYGAVNAVMIEIWNTRVPNLTWSHIFKSLHVADDTLNGYVISLQKLDALLKADIKKGIVRIEKTEIIGVDDKEYDL